MAKRDIKSDPVIGSSDEEQDDDEPKPKKIKQSKDSETTSWQSNDQGDAFTEIGSAKRVTVRKFKKTILIDVREFYTDKDSGEAKPGKKGISLTPDQWEKLKGACSQIDAEIEKLK